MARQWTNPAVTAVNRSPVASARVFTSTGSNLLDVVRSPSWPPLLRPHEHITPSEQSARLWDVPAATAETLFPDSLVKVLTATGVRWLTLKPVPS
jgi:hypothetical protein